MRILKDLLDTAKTYFDLRFDAEFWPESEIPKPVTLKRTAWTNEEVMAILEKLKITPTLRSEELYADAFNNGIDAAIIEFSNFNQPATESGAMAYSTQTGEIFHIGPKLPR